MKRKQTQDSKSLYQRFLGWFSLPKLSYIAGIVAAIVVVTTFIINISNEGDIPKRVKEEEIFVSATADPSKPAQYSKVIIHVSVKDNNDKPVINSPVETVAHYRTTKSRNKGITDYSGKCEIEYRISGATIGYEVRVDVSAQHEGSKAYASTSFTPTAR